MVVLSVAVVTKAGKPIIARQFRELPRARLESLLSTFPKLVPPSSQHTVIDDPASSIRYVYQPLDDLWLVVLTNRQSNILQDIDTLHLLSRVIGDFCRGNVNELDVLSRSFEILSSFDEVVCMGYREKMDLNGIRSVMEMESHEEKIQDIIARNKEQEAKEELKRRAKQLDLQRREAMKRGHAEPFAGGGGMHANFERVYQAPVTPVLREETSFTSPATAKPFKSKGMQLGASRGGSKSSRQQAGLLDALGDEYQVTEPISAIGTAVAHSANAAVPSPGAQVASVVTHPFAPEVQEDVHFVLKEKLSLELSRDGGLSSAGIVVAGSLDLRVATAASARILVQLESRGDYGNDLQFKTHPNVDKKAWTDLKLVQLKDLSRGFPVGQALGVLKWRLATKDESSIPLSINCWPTANDNGSCDVNIEYELEADHLALANVVISIPLPPGSYPTINSANGSHTIQEDHTLDWKIDRIEGHDDTKTGSMEFSCPGTDVDAFFPLNISFACGQGLCGVKVASVVAVEGEAPVPFSVDCLSCAEDFAIV